MLVCRFVKRNSVKLCHVPLKLNQKYRSNIAVRSHQKLVRSQQKLARSCFFLIWFFTSETVVLFYLFALSACIGNGVMCMSVCISGPHWKRSFASVANKLAHISDMVGDTDPFSVSDGVFGPFPMCRSVLVWPKQLCNIPCNRLV